MCSRDRGVSNPLTCLVMDALHLNNATELSACKYMRSWTTLEVKSKYERALAVAFCWNHGLSNLLNSGPSPSFGMSGTLSPATMGRQQGSGNGSRNAQSAWLSWKSNFLHRTIKKHTFNWVCKTIINYHILHSDRPAFPYNFKKITNSYRK